MTLLLALTLLATNPVSAEPLEDHVVAIDHNRCNCTQVIFWREYPEKPGELHVGDWRFERSIPAWQIEYVGDRYRCTFFDDSDDNGILRVVWCNGILHTATAHDPERHDFQHWTERVTLTRKPARTHCE